MFAQSELDAMCDRCGKEFLPENSNILRFQELFDIVPDAVSGKDVLLWVFKNPKLPPENYPEDTGLQRKLTLS